MDDRAFVELELKIERLKTNKDILKAFLLDKGDSILVVLVVKSTTVTMSFTPVEIRQEIFKKMDLWKLL